MSNRWVAVALFAAITSSTRARAQSVADPAAAAEIGDDSIRHPAEAQTGLLGDPGGFRKKLADDGITLSVGYKGEAATNLSGGDHKDAAYTAQLAIAGHFDLDRIAGVQGGSLQTTISYRHGHNLNDVSGIDSLQQIVEVYGRGQTWRLSEFYYQQQLANGAVILRAGRMTAQDFDPSDCEFMNVSWCGAPAGNITSYWYNFPVAQWGGWLKVRSNKAYAQLGLYEDNRNNLSGGFFNLRGKAKGAILRMQAGATPSLGSPQLPGRYQLGYWHTSASDPDVRDDANNKPYALTGLAPRQVDGQSGLFAQAQQQLSGSATLDPVSGTILRERGANVFVNYTHGDRRTSTLVDQLTGGFYLDAPFRTRPDDHFGIAGARNHFNSRAVDRPMPGGLMQGERNSEYVFETYYAVGAMRGVSLRPDVQYVVNPGGLRAAHDAVILGMRFDITL